MTEIVLGNFQLTEIMAAFAIGNEKHVTTAPFYLRNAR
jgi:hypothetical protein